MFLTELISLSFGYVFVQNSGFNFHGIPKSVKCIVSVK